jgi:two-component system sensor histidine kinase UhpB
MTDAANLTTECKLELEGRRLPFEIESTLYRIAQESMTNIVRHARATHIFVELISLPYAICLRIDDDGVGFDPEAIVNGGDTRRLGLIGMRERAEMLDGSLEVHSGSGAGTSVRVRIPLQMEGTS